MTDFDSFSQLVFTIAGPRATGLKAQAGAVSFMLDVSDMTTDERIQIEEKL